METFNFKLIGYEKKASVLLFDLCIKVVLEL